MSDRTPRATEAGDGFHALLYFGIQRLRRGVKPALIEQMARLLESGSREIDRHVERRLSAVHRPDGPPLSWLARQPLVERDQLRPTMEEAGRTRRRRPLEWRSTSGSTGTPFTLVKDMEMSAHMDATMWALYRWHGLLPGAPHARFWGMPLASGRRLRKHATDWIMHRRRMDAFALAQGRAIRFFHGLRRLGPTYAYGYPTLLRHFVEECAAAGLDGRELRMKAVVSTGELLIPETRRAMAEFFGCRVVNEYGCTESGILAFECEEGTMHLTPAATYAEIVLADGTPAPPGKGGEVVVSDLYGSVVPLLRYRLHDRAVLGGEACPCGRDLPTLRVDSGRIDSFIQTPQRGPVYDAVLAYTVPRTVQRFRAYQVAPDLLAVELLPGVGFNPESTPEECRVRWEEALGPGMRVTTRVVDTIPYEVSGKLRYFVPLEGTPAPEEPPHHPAPPEATEAGG
jgi:phenylacetate-CoA ligase